MISGVPQPVRPQRFPRMLSLAHNRPAVSFGKLLKFSKACRAFCSP
jgi:hypothetical protein